MNESEKEHEKPRDKVNYKHLVDFVIFMIVSILYFAFLERYSMLYYF